MVGKRANFAYLEGLDVLVLRQPTAEHCYVDFLAGPTLVGWRQTFEDVPFEARTTGEDSAFLRSLIAAGRTIYAADRFNFIQVRGRKHAGSSHTWDVSDWHFLADGQVQTRGLHFSHVEA